MLTFSLIISTVLWMLSVAAAFASKPAFVRKASSAVLIAAIAATFLECWFPALALQAILVLIGNAAWRHYQWKPTSLAYISTAALLISYGVAAGFAGFEVKRMQDSYPVVSLEERLPALPIRDAEVNLPKASAERLDHLEHELQKKSETVNAVMRRQDLRKLHEDVVHAFISQPGFGAGRMTSLSEFWIRGRKGKPLPQPGPPMTSSWSAGSFNLHSSNDSQKAQWTQILVPLHEQSQLDFLDPRDFGYVRNRQFVAGFIGHAFRKERIDPESWDLRTVSLIGLVMHKKPVVYVSANLPNMDELRTAETLPPDDFENAGLEKLRSGDDLFIHAEGGVIRAVGSLRATKHCMACHGGNRGDLLGAFSYMLVAPAR